MDPYSAAIIGLATAALNAYTAGVAAFMSAPEEYRDGFYKRLGKIEVLADPALELATKAAEGLMRAIKADKKGADNGTV